MTILCLIYVVSVFVSCTLVTSQTTEREMSTTADKEMNTITQRTGVSESAVCRFDPREAGAKLRAVDAAFSHSQVTDIVFLIDRSESIPPKAFDTTKDTLRALMDYLMLSRRLYLHGDYARVAVVSFGVRSMVEFNGIDSNSDTVHACNIDDKLHDLELGSTGRNATNLDSALVTAEKIFKSSPRKGATQILWIFHDGESSKRSETFTWKLKHHGVIVFSAGVGRAGVGWMDTVVKEKHVKSFAQDTHHYACAIHWTSIIRDEKEKVQLNSGKEVDGEPLYVTDNTYSSGKCASCPESKRCVCDVKNRQYTCADAGVIDTRLVIAIVIVSSVVVLVVLVVVCHRFVFRRCHSNKPPELAPRVAPRKTADEWPGPDNESDFRGRKSDYYNVSPGHTSPEWLQQSAEQNDIYIVPMQHATVHGSVEEQGDDSRTQHGSASEKAVSCETPPWYLSMTGPANVDEAAPMSTTNTSIDVHKTSSISPSAFKYDYVYEQILTGPIECRRRVLRLAEGRGVRGLLIYDTATARHWAATPGFLLPPAEIATFQQILGQSELSKCSDVTAAGKAYAIDRSELSDLHLHATSRSGDHLWVARQGDYVIVCVADPHKGKDCENAVIDVQQNLQKKALEDETETASSSLYVQPNTWSENYYNAAVEDKTETASSPLYLTPNTLSQS